MVRLDMSEFQERHTVSRLVGAPPGYVGYEEAGQLTETVRRRPYSVLLLDEIEKAHPDVFNLLLQLLEDGRLTDGQGRTVDFRHTVVIMTSNLGADRIQAHARRDESFEELKDDLMELLRQSFRPELLNRIDEIIVFRALDREQLKQITRLLLAKVERRMHAQGVELEVSDEAVEFLATRASTRSTGRGRSGARSSACSRTSSRSGSWPATSSRGRVCASSCETGGCTWRRPVPERPAMPKPPEP